MKKSFLRCALALALVLAGVGFVGKSYGQAWEYKIPSSEIEIDFFNPTSLHQFVKDIVYQIQVMELTLEQSG